jgi:hypothetical protein
MRKSGERLPVRIRLGCGKPPISNYFSLTGKKPFDSLNERLRNGHSGVWRNLSPECPAAQRLALEVRLYSIGRKLRLFFRR